MASALAKEKRIKSNNINSKKQSKDETADPKDNGKTADPPPPFDDNDGVELVSMMELIENNFQA